MTSVATVHVGAVRPPGVLTVPRISGTTVALALLGLLLAGSGASESRLELAGMSVHPMLLLVAVLAVVHSAVRLKKFPSDLGMSLLGFVVIFGIAVLMDPLMPLNALMKVVSITATIVVAALLVKSERDFRIGVYGMLLGVGAIGLSGILRGEIGAETFNPMHDASGNKNSYSLYALPALLLGGYVMIQPGISVIRRILVGVGALVIALPVFLSANRSGWLGAVFVVTGLLMQSSGRRPRTLIILATVTLLMWFLLTNIDLGVFERRLDQTIAGYESDDLRQTLLKQCFLIGLDNPLIGVGPNAISFELARRIPGYEHPFVGPHNAITYLFGAGGAGLVVAWIATGRGLLRQGRALVGNKGGIGLMHLLIGLWLVRGLFTDEILYSPAFGLAFGLVIGLCQVAARDAAAEATAQAA
jgi:hypothetical protein